MNQTVSLLKEIWSGARQGLESLRAILDITDDTNFRNELYNQETQYQNIVRDAENQLAAQNDRPDGVNAMTRVCTWTGIRMDTFANKSTPHLIGMIIQGNTMGIIEITKVRADYPEADQSAHSLAAALITLQQDNIDRCLPLLQQAEALTAAR